jgi:hypothetical protein
LNAGGWSHVPFLVLISRNSGNPSDDWHVRRISRDPAAHALRFVSRTVVRPNIAQST